MRFMNKFLFIHSILFLTFFSLFISNTSKADQNITEIQTMLKAQGYSVGVIDGKAGKNTKRAIKNWQHINNFDETGNIGENQLNFMRIQNSDGTKLNNEDLSIIQERNKKYKQKTKSKIGIFGKILGWLGVIVLLLGFLAVIGGSAGKKDARFKSGHADNNTGDGGVQGVGCLMILVGGGFCYLFYYLYLS